MDVKAFSTSPFDASKWIKETLSSAPVDTDKEQYISSLVLKLQLLITKLNHNLEDQSVSISNNVARVSKECEQLQQQVVLIKAKMDATRDQMSRVSGKGNDSMAELIELDGLKTRLRLLSKALREAENWSVLCEEIEQALEKNDIDVATAKLKDIQNSLKILNHVPDFEQKAAHVESLKSKLETLASPQVLLSFTEGDAVKAKHFVHVFEAIGRSDQLMQYYNRCIGAKALKMWTAIIHNGQHDSTLLKYFTLFFDQMIVLLEEQKQWFLSVFGDNDPNNNMLSILLQVHSALEPTPSFCLEASLKMREDKLTFLTDLKACIQQYVASITSTLALGNTMSKGAEGKGIDEGLVRQLLQTLYLPLKAHLTNDYEQLETSLLTHEIADLVVSSKDLIDELRNIGNAIPKIFSSFREAARRCCELTEGCGFPALKRSMSTCLASFLGKLSALMRRLERRKSTAHNWIIFQQSLSLNQYSGDIILQLERLDIDLSLNFLERTKDFLGPHTSPSPSGQFHLYLMEFSALHELEMFYVTVRDGEEYPLVSDCLSHVRKLCSELQTSTFSILFNSIESELKTVSDPDLWAMGTVDLPEASFSPHEYITKIGQFLMTMPQHLEPFLADDSAGLIKALQEHVFPYSSGVTESEETNAVDFILSCMTRATAEVYQKCILKIPTLSFNATRQLACDLNYLGDILEDLGHPLPDSLTAILFMLKVSCVDLNNPEFIKRAKELEKCPTKIVSQIQTMRKALM